MTCLSRCCWSRRLQTPARANVGVKMRRDMGMKEEERQKRTISQDEATNGRKTHTNTGGGTRAVKAGTSPAQSVRCCCIPSYVYEVEEEAEQENGKSGFTAEVLMSLTYGSPL